MSRDSVVMIVRVFEKQLAKNTQKNTQNRKKFTKWKKIDYNNVIDRSDVVNTSETKFLKSLGDNLPSSKKSSF